MPRLRLTMKIIKPCVVHGTTGLWRWEEVGDCEL